MPRIEAAPTDQRADFGPRCNSLAFQLSFEGVLAAFRAPGAGGFRGRGRGKGIGVISRGPVAMAVSRTIADGCTTGATIPVGSGVERASAAVPSSGCTGGGCSSGTAGPGDQRRGSNTDCDPAATCGGGVSSGSVAGGGSNPDCARGW